MQPLNDDDMDELMRRAAEDYPLNTDSADWNKVMQQLHGGEENLPEEFKKKKDFKYLWLLLLLPIGFICGKYVSNGNNDAITTSSNLPNRAIAPNTDHSSGKTATSIKANGPANKPGAITEIGNRDVTDSNNTDSGSVNGSRQNKSVVRADVKNKGIVSVNATSTHGRVVSPFPVKRSAVNANVTKESKDNNYETPMSVLNNTAAAVKSKEEIKDTAKELTDQTAEKVKAPVANKVPVKADTTSAKSLVESVESQVPEKSIAKPPFKKYAYYSLLFGPDVSMVKLQKTSNAGYSIGLMLGFQFSKKISVEAGALWARKNYYSKGDYLDTSKLQLPMHSVVSKAEGMCNMIEIPVNIKYDFITKKRHSWFISTGLSSYLMKKENYNLSYERYNQPYVKDYDYTNSSRDWFSIMSISAGYKTLAGKTNISVAPYAKLPLKGVGIGKLPVTSAGLYIILSRSVH